MDKVKLVSVCDFQGGSQPPKEEWSSELKDGYIRMLQIRDFTQTRNFEKEYIKLTPSTKICKSDDVLIARYGASVGKILTGLSGAYNVAIMKAIPNENILSKSYLRYYLLSNYFQNRINRVGNRAAQAGFNKEDLSKFDINLISLENQKIVSNTLDKLTDLIDKRKKQLEKLDELIKSRFVEMFGDINVNDKKWDTEQLGNLCDISRGGSPRPIEQYLGGTVPWIKIGDATDGENIYLNSTKEHILESGVKKSRLVKKGSLIFANCGVSLGFARIITFDGCIHDGWLAMENIDIRLDKVFLLHSLNQMTEHFRAIAPAGTQPNLNTAIMKAYRQVIPPIEMQKRYISFVEKIDKLKSEAQKGLEKLELLKNALMQKYFR